MPVRSKPTVPAEPSGFLPFTWMRLLGSAPGAGQHGRVCQGTTAEKESRSVVRGAQESDRSAPLAPAEIEVCAGAVLLGSGCAEHQATSAVPQPTNCTATCHHLEKRKQLAAPTPARTRSVQSESFSTPTDVIANLVHNLEFSESQTSQPHDLRPRLPRSNRLSSVQIGKEGTGGER